MQNLAHFKNNDRKQKFLRKAYIWLIYNKRRDTPPRTTHLPVSEMIQAGRLRLLGNIARCEGD